MKERSISCSRGLLSGTRLARSLGATVASVALAVVPATPSVAQSVNVRTDFDSAESWVNAAPPGVTPPNHAASIVADGGNSVWQWDIDANQPNGFLVGLPLAETDPNLNALITPLLDTSAQAKFHVDGGQPDAGLGVQVAIVSRFSIGSLDLPQGYCLLVGDGRMDLARFDFNGPLEPFEILASLDGADFTAAGGFDINPDQDEVDVIMRLDVVDDPNGNAVMSGWIWDASTTPDTSFFDTPMITTIHDHSFPAGVLGLEARTNSTTEAMTVAFDWLEATGTVPVPEPNGLVLLFVGGLFVAFRCRLKR